MWKHFVGVALASLVARTAAASPVQVVFSGTVSTITHDSLLAYSLDPSVTVGARFSGSWHGTALPALPFSLTDFPQTSVDLFFVDSHGYAINLYGALDALAVVPEPSRLVLCVLAAAALALQRQ